MPNEKLYSKLIANSSKIYKMDQENNPNLDLAVKQLLDEYTANTEQIMALQKAANNLQRQAIQEKENPYLQKNLGWTVDENTLGNQLGKPSNLVTMYEKMAQKARSAKEFERNRELDLLYNNIKGLQLDQTSKEFYEKKEQQRQELLHTLVRQQVEIDSGLASEDLVGSGKASHYRRYMPDDLTSLGSHFEALKNVGELTLESGLKGLTNFATGSSAILEKTGEVADLLTEGQRGNALTRWMKEKGQEGQIASLNAKQNLDEYFNSGEGPTLDDISDAWKYGSIKDVASRVADLGLTSFINDEAVEAAANIAAFKSNPLLGLAMFGKSIPAKAIDMTMQSNPEVSPEDIITRQKYREQTKENLTPSAFYNALNALGLFTMVAPTAIQASRIANKLKKGNKLDKAPKRTTTEASEYANRPSVRRDIRAIFEPIAEKKPLTTSIVGETTTEALQTKMETLNNQNMTPYEKEKAIKEAALTGGLVGGIANIPAHIKANMDSKKEKETIAKQDTSTKHIMREFRKDFDSNKERITRLPTYEMAKDRVENKDTRDLDSTVNTILANAHKKEAKELINQAISEIKNNAEESKNPFVQKIRDKLLQNTVTAVNILGEEKASEDSSLIPESSKEILRDIVEARDLGISSIPKDSLSKEGGSFYTPLDKSQQQSVQDRVNRLKRDFDQYVKQTDNPSVLNFLRREENKVKGRVSLEAFKQFRASLDDKYKRELEEARNLAKLEKEEKKREKEAKEERKVEPLSNKEASIIEIDNENLSFIDMSNISEDVEDVVDIKYSSDLKKVNEDLIVGNTILNNYPSDVASDGTHKLYDIASYEKRDKTTSIEKKTTRYKKVVKAHIAKALKRKESYGEDDSIYKQTILDLAEALIKESEIAESSPEGDMVLATLIEEISKAGLLVEVSDRISDMQQGQVTTVSSKEAKDLYGSEDNDTQIVQTSVLNVANMQRRLKDVDPYLKSGLEILVGLQVARREKRINFGGVSLNQWQDISQMINKVLSLLNIKNQLSRGAFTNTLNSLYDAKVRILQDINSKKRALKTAFDAIKTSNNRNSFYISNPTLPNEKIVFYRYNKENPTAITVLSPEDLKEIKTKENIGNDRLIEAILDKNTNASNTKYGYITSNEVDTLNNANELSLHKLLTEQEKNINNITQNITSELEIALKEQIKKESAPIVGNAIESSLINPVSTARGYIESIAGLKRKIAELRKSLTDLRDKKDISVDTRKKIQETKEKLNKAIKDYDILVMRFRKGLIALSEDQLKIIDDYLVLGSVYDRATEIAKFLDKTSKLKIVEIFQAKSLLKSLIKLFNSIANSIINKLNLDDAEQKYLGITLIDINKLKDNKKELYEKGIILRNLGKLEGKYKYTHPELAKEALEQRLNVHSSQKGFLKVVELSKKALSKNFSLYLGWSDLVIGTGNEAVVLLKEKVKKVKIEKAELTSFSDLFTQAKEGVSHLKNIYAEALVVAYAIFQRDIKTVSAPLIDKGGVIKEAASSENLDVKLARTFMDVLEVQFSKELTNKETREAMLQALGKSLNEMVTSAGLNAEENEVTLKDVRDVIGKSLVKREIGFYTTRSEAINYLKDSLSNGLFSQDLSLLKKTAMFIMATQAFNVDKTGVLGIVKDSLNNDITTLAEMFVHRHPKVGSILFNDPRNKEYTAQVTLTDNFKYNMKYIRDYIEQVPLKSTDRSKIIMFLNNVLSQWGFQGQNNLQVFNTVLITEPKKQVTADVDSYSSKVSSALREYVDMLVFASLNDKDKEIYLQVDLQQLMRTSNTKFQSNKDLRNMLYYGSDLTPEEAKKVNEKKTKELKGATEEETKINNFMEVLNSLDVYTPARKSLYDVKAKKQSIRDNGYADKFYKILEDNNLSDIKKAYEIQKLIFDVMGEDMPYSSLSVANVVEAFRDTKNIDYNKLQLWMDASAQGSAMVNTLVGITMSQREVAQRSGLGVEVLKLTRKETAAYQKEMQSQDNYHTMVKVWLESIFSGIMPVNDKNYSVMNTPIELMFPKVDTKNWNRKTLIEKFSKVIDQKYNDRPLMALIFKAIIRNVIPAKIDNTIKNMLDTQQQSPEGSGVKALHNLTLEEIIFKTPISSTARNLIGKGLLMLINYGSTNANNAGKAILSALGDSMKMYFYRINKGKEDDAFRKIFSNIDLTNTVLSVYQDESNLIKVLQDNKVYPTDPNEALDLVTDLTTFVMFMKEGLEIKTHQDLKKYIGNNSQGFSSEDIDVISRNLGKAVLPVVNKAISAATGFSEEVLDCGRVIQHLKTYSLLKKFVITLLKNKKLPYNEKNVSRYIYLSDKKDGFILTNLEEFTDVERQQAIQDVTNNITKKPQLKNFYGRDSFNDVLAANVLIQIKEDTEAAEVNKEAEPFSTPSQGLTLGNTEKRPTKKYFVAFGSSFSPAMGQEADSFIVDDTITTLANEGISFWHVFDSLATNSAEADKVASVANSSVRNYVENITKSRLYKSFAHLEDAWATLVGEMPEITKFAFDKAEGGIINTEEDVASLPYIATGIAIRMSFTEKLYTENKNFISINMFNSGTSKIKEASLNKEIKTKEITPKKKSEIEEEKRIENYNLAVTKTEKLLHIARLLGIKNGLMHLDTSSSLVTLIESINNVLEKIKALDIDFSITGINRNIPKGISTQNILSTIKDNKQTSTLSIIHNIHKGIALDELEAIENFLNTPEAIITSKEDVLTSKNPLFNFAKRNVYKESIKRYLRNQGLPSGIANMLSTHLTNAILQPTTGSEDFKDKLDEIFSLARNSADTKASSVTNVIKVYTDSKSFTIKELSNSVAKEENTQLKDLKVSLGLDSGQEKIVRKIMNHIIAKSFSSKASEKIPEEIKFARIKPNSTTSSEVLALMSVLAKAISKGKLDELSSLIGLEIEDNKKINDNAENFVGSLLKKLFNNQTPTIDQLSSYLKETNLDKAVVEFGEVSDTDPRLSQDKAILDEVNKDNKIYSKPATEYGDIQFSEQDIQFSEQQENMTFEVTDIVEDRLDLDTQDFEEVSRKLIDLHNSNTYNNSDPDWIMNRVSSFISPFAKGVSVTVAKGKGINTSGQYRSSSNHISVYITDTTVNKMSPVEIFAHEGTHAIIEEAKRSNDPIVKNALSELQDIQKRFLNYAKLHTKEIADKLGVSEEVFKTKYMKYMERFEEFASITNSNQIIWQVLNEIPYKVSLGQKFFNILKMLSNFVFRTNFILDGIPSAERFDKLYLSMANAQSNLESSYNNLMIERAIRSSLNLLDKKISPIAKIPFNVWAKSVETLLDKQLAKEGKISKITASLLGLASVIVMNKGEIGPKIIEIARRAGKDSNLGQSLLSHLAGVDKEFSELKGSSMQIDVLRNNTIAAYKELLKEAIGQDLTIEQQQHFTKALKRTDITALDSIDEMIEAITDTTGSFLDKQIAEVKSRIRVNLSNNAKHNEYVLTASENLAHYMVTGETKGFFLTNATNIAKGYTTYPMYDVNQKNIRDIDQLTLDIDRLVTLMALKMTPRENFDSVRAIPEENLRKTLEVINEVNKKARAVLVDTDRNLTNYVKGYVKTPLSKSVSIRVGNKDAKEYMKELGYIPVEGFKPSGNLFINDLVLYYSNTEYNQAFNMGTLRNITSKTRGYTIGAYLRAKFPNENVQTLKAMTISNVKVLADLLNDPKSPNWKGLNLIPVFDSKGKTHDFRITIPNAIRDKLGLPEPSIFDAVGDEMGNLLDKELSEAHNKNMIRDLENYYLAHKDDKNIHFITLSSNPAKSNSNISEKKLEEMWDSLDIPIKNFIIKNYGGEIHIRSDLLHTIMGYRDFRLIDSDTEPDNILPNNKVRRILRLIEASAYKIGALNKSRVVLKNPKTVWNNIKSNIFVMSLYDYPLSSLLPDTLASIRNLEAYNLDMRKKALLMSRRKTSKEVKSLDAQIKYIDEKWKNTSIKALDDRGLYSDIVSDDSFESEVNNPDMFEKLFDKGFSYIKNPLQRNALKEAMMTNDSQGFALMKKVFTYSDMVFKDIAYQFLTKEKGMSKDQALMEIEKAFVNYSNLEHPILKYLGDMNVLMFPKYTLNITRFISNDMFQDKLGRTLVAGLIDMATDFVVTPLSSFIPLKISNVEFLVNTPLLQPVSSFIGLGENKYPDIFAIDNFLPIDVRM